MVPLFRKHICNLLQRSQFKTRHPNVLKRYQVADSFRYRRSYSSASYDDYRNPLSRKQWKELEEDVIHTHKRIDQNLCQHLLNELISESTNKSNQGASTPEYGPSGTFQYSFSNEEDGRLLYTRSFQEIEQTVLNLEPGAQIFAMSLSVDESMIAYIYSDISGQGIRVRNIDSETEIDLEAPGDLSLSSLEWGPKVPNTDHDHSFYVVGADQQGRPDRVYAGSISADTLSINNELGLIFQCNDRAAMVDVQRTKGHEFIAIRAYTKQNNEVFLSSGPTSELVPVIFKQEHLQYHLDVGEENDLVLLVSENGQEYKVLETKVGELPLDPFNLEKYQAKGLQSENGYSISDMDLFRNHIVFYERSKTNGLERIRTQKRSAGSKQSIVPLSMENQECYKLSPTGSIFYGSENLYFQVESPVDPGRLLQFDLEKQELMEVSEMMKRNSAATKPVCNKRVFVTSQDGTKVPLSLIYNEEEEETGILSFFGSEREPRNVVLFGYGSYGEPTDIQYDPYWSTLLQRGFVVAFAHGRGGGDLGRTWYYEGCRENKLKSIEDFEACAHYLKDRYSEGKLTAKTFSAGGAMVGAVMNRDPELFDNVVFTNAFLDIHATMSNEDLYLTPHDWGEYGNPLDNADIDELIKSYCPVTNLKTMATCPQTLIVGTLDDENVPFWNAVHFAKKLRDCIQDFDKVHLHLEATGGHHLGSRKLHVYAVELTFIIQNS